MKQSSMNKDWRFVVLGVVAVGLIAVQTVFLTVTLARLEATTKANTRSGIVLVGDCPAGSTGC